MSELHNKDKGKERSDNLFPVVGVGASAGGLDAFKRLIKAIPENAGVAYILVQHLEPSHDSMLVEILQKVTSIPVQEITNNVRVEPNRVYVIPSNKLLTANDGRLELSPRAPKGEKNMPIDLFFTSLAVVHQSHAIGVVLSGTASDGTQGLKAIKEYGGFTFAQEPQSAAYSGMPQSAIDADAVDFILSPEEIPLQLARISEIFRISMEGEKEDIKTAREDAFRQLIALLRVRKGNDFTYYKQTTIRRRIMRRMGLNKIDSITDYLTFFRENIAEQDLLYQDLLIPVTGFFRDPKTFTALSETVFPNVLKGKDDANPIRFWIAGCSTGEEPYSMAISLSEYLEERIADYKIQIFATDISERSIAKARIGIYAKKDMGGLNAYLLEKYFTRVNGGYHINKTVRDLCVFACHNFLKDPPFAKMSLISCRNVLIYMETFLQKKALTTFHYALNENGYLLLGNSETTAPASELFATYGKSEKIYTRKSVPGKFLHLVSGKTENIPKGNGSNGKKEPGRDDFQRSADEAVIQRFSPSGVVVNEEMDIVQFRGSTGAWLEPPPGKPSLNVLKMVKPGLSFELRNALHKAKTDNQPVVKKGIPLVSPEKQQLVALEVIPLLNTIERYYLVLFWDERLRMPGEEPDEATREAMLKGMAESERNSQLEKEMAQLREDIRSVTEDQEAVNEELQSANEELLSGSEELQSLNEELETSKEEIQSTNEELTTLNQELLDRNEQLNIARLYAESIIATIREPLIVLDKDMKVRTANQSYYKKFKTSEEETEGRPFYQLKNRLWDIPAFRSALENSLLTDGRITDVEIKQKFEDIGERTLLLNACRIAKKDDAELLILLAFEDITDSRNRENDLINFSRELETKVDERTLSLKEANNLLKQSNDSLEQFATIASHDLQEPLRKIQTFSALLNERYRKDITGEARELINKISLSAQRMSGMISDVLNFSKVLDANVFEQVNLNVILQNVRNDFDMLIEQKKAVITQDELPVIKAVPLQMNQLFFNLLGNAIKFSRPDVAPVIHISCRMLTNAEVQTHPSLDKALSYYDIIFSDNGIGIDKAFMEQVFQIFQRLNARERFEGTGIGLALCKKIVLNHKGEIYIRSKEGVGTEFHVLLPKG
ncbi:chemotaxis protein CheB [Niastella sp. OAS944]|uniref:chemotaxis protein CheB n=1 Tax=Niastella sp. OAS944 TaxID=2664089 RepID=UPI003480E3BF|nr:two-component system CheB/CheR fusion protein [Chitinophagaceae bacterium OAS944]